jgi:hypothetical protein
MVVIGTDEIVEEYVGENGCAMFRSVASLTSRFEMCRNDNLVLNDILSQDVSSYLVRQ